MKRDLRLDLTVAFLRALLFSARQLSTARAALRQMHSPDAALAATERPDAVTVFEDYERAVAELQRRGSGWVLEENRWLLREKTVEEYVDDWRFADQAVVLEIRTDHDLRAEEMVERDYEELGRWIVEMAARARAAR